MSNQRKRIDAALDGLFSSKRRTSGKVNPLAVDVSGSSRGPDETAPAPEKAEVQAEPVGSGEPAFIAAAAEVVVEIESTSEALEELSLLDQAVAAVSIEAESPRVHVQPDPIGAAVVVRPPAVVPVDTSEKLDKTPVPQKRELVGPAVPPAAVQPQDTGIGLAERQPELNATENATAGEIQIVVFRLENQYYGVEINRVEAIIKMQNITRVPHSYDYVRGLTNLRGSVLPVIDLRKRFSLPEDKLTKDTRIIVLIVEAEKVGMIVDGVSEVATLASRAIEPAPAMVTTIDTTYLTGIGKLEDKLIMLIDMARIINIGGKG